MTAESLTCERDGTPTALRCAGCATPICPRCSQRSAVGFKCHQCAAGVVVPQVRRRLWPVIVAVVAVCALGLLVVRVRGGEDKPTPVSATGGAGQPTGFRALTLTELGYAVDVPAGWFPAADNSPSTTSYAAFRPTLGSLRVTVGQDDSTLADHVARLIQALGQQGGINFRQSPTQVSGLAAIRLDYRFPVGANPGPPISSHTSYLVKRDSTVFSFQLATTDPGGEAPLFAHMAASMRLL